MSYLPLSLIYNSVTMNCKNPLKGVCVSRRICLLQFTSGKFGNKNIGKRITSRNCKIPGILYKEILPLKICYLKQKGPKPEDNEFLIIVRKYDSLDYNNSSSDFYET